jgi:phage terminase large subunit-like protein
MLMQMMRKKKMSSNKVLIKLNPETHPNCVEGVKYAEEVRDGIREVPKMVKLCVARFFKDVERARELEAPFFLDWDYAERFMRVTQKFQHAKGANWKSPFILYEPWQQFKYLYMFGFKNSKTTRRRFRTASLWEPRGNGKAHPIDQIVPTPEGLKKWKEIEVGSMLIGGNGKPCTVIGKTPITRQRVYKVLFNGVDSTSLEIIECSKEHEWPTDRGLLETHQLILGDKVGDKYVWGTKATLRFKRMFCVEVDSPDHTYLIGRTLVKTHNSASASQVGLYMLSLDGEVGPEVICASTKKESARIVLDSSRVMAMKNDKFLKNTNTIVFAHNIVHSPSHGIMKAVASEASSNDGINGNCIIGDEMHEWKRDLYDVLDSSLSKRDDSLFFMISTAGLSTEGIGYELYTYSKKVLEGHVEDDTWFTMIWEMDEFDNWESQKVWTKVNPNWGVSVDPINFEAKAKKAAETPASKHNFLVKHLNSWQNQASSYFGLELWDRCKDDSLTLSMFKGKKCAMALDLAQKVDLCSRFYIFKEKVNGVFKYFLFQRSYLPEARIVDNKNVLYSRWAEEGYLDIMPGEVNDFEKIQKDIIQDSRDFKVFGLNADPWSANETLQKLIKAKIPANEFRMSTQNLSEPMKQLDALIRSGQVVHNGDPLLRWCLGNVVAKEDANGNVFPRKTNERLKIDPIVAGIMALAIWMLEEEKTSVYENRGIRSV